MRRSLDNESVKFSRGDPFRERSSKPVKEVKDPLLFLMDLGGTLLQQTYLASSSEDHEGEHSHDKSQESYDNMLNRLKNHERQ